MKEKGETMDKIREKLLTYFDEDNLQAYGKNTKDILKTAVKIIANDTDTNWEEVYCSREIDILVYAILAIIGKEVE